MNIKAKGLRLRVVSDFHIDYNGGAPASLFTDDNFDILVIAGDVCESSGKAVAWLASQKAWADKPIIFTPGNHEAYGFEIEDDIAQGRAAARATQNRVSYLDMGQIIVETPSGNIRFIGATLWTDYRLFDRPLEAMTAARQGMSDHFEIKSATPNRMLRPFSPEDALDRHERHRAFIDLATRENFDGPTIVVTHHAPSARSVHPRFQRDALTPAYASPLDDFAREISERGVALWIHGHMHHSIAYPLGKLHVICNAVAYGAVASRHNYWENPHFDPRLTIDLA